jgi:hypothetical protein
MKKTIGALIVVLAIGGGVAAAVAVGRASGDDKPLTTTVKAKEPQPAVTQTATTDETVTVDPGTVTVTDANEDDVEQIEAVVTHEVPGVDESQIENIHVSGDQATAKLADGGTVSLRREAGRWQPESVQRPPREAGGAGGGEREPQAGSSERESRSRG